MSKIVDSNREGQSSRTALLVLGMHRSGTSALTRVLSLLGATLPEKIMAAGRGNETGHWEPERLVKLHDEMLAEAGSRWDDWRAFDPDVLGSERLSYYKGEIERLIREDYGAASLIVLKDPRLCRLIPLYKQVFNEMGIETRYVLTFRNPLSVMDSLSARDAIIPSHAALVWLRYVLDAEAHTREKPRSFLAYEDYLEDWRSEIQKLSSDLGIEWPVALDDARSEIDSFLSKDHRHHLATVEDLVSDERIGSVVQNAYEALISLSRGSDAKALETISSIRADMESGSVKSLDMQPEDWRDIAASFFEEMNHRQHRERLNSEHLQRVIANQRSEQETRIRGLEAQLADQKKQTDALLVQRIEYGKQTDKLNEQTDALKADRDRLLAELSALRNSTSWRLTRPVRLAKRMSTDPRGTLKALRRIRSEEKSSFAPEPGEQPEKSARNTPIPGLANLTQDEIKRLRTAFDTDFYLDRYSDIAEAGIDPFEHYMRSGWKELRDPSSRFSTAYYLQNSPQISQAGINPFIHWARNGYREKRPTIPFQLRLELLDYSPKVSVVVPNYNHARFLKQRVESILTQTYTNLDVLILDDCSTDESRGTIERLRAQDPDRIKTLLNKENSGNVFRQWRKGIENSDGELVWICESDDFCEPDFLEGLVQKFKDRSVNIAFGRIQFSNQNGEFQEGMDQYREGAEAGIWDVSISRPAQRWFAGGFGVNNVIANVGGCVFRRQTLPEIVWREAEKYSILGDWFLYAHLAGGGKISYEPSSVAYFRQHTGNTSVASFVTPGYYEEHERLMTLLRRKWEIPDETVERFYEKIVFQYSRHKLEEKLGPLASYCDKNKLLAEKRTQPHTLIAFLGFHPGGGEVFPLYLANELHAQGHRISMMALDMSEVRQEMIDALDPGIPVYDSAWVKEHGADRFLSDAGVSLVHSHMLSLEAFFFEECRIVTQIPYVVTLHGSYEASSMTRERLIRILLGVSHFVYTADKNLEPFHKVPLSDEIFTKLGNALPDDLRPFPKTREEIGIPDDAVVFTLVARGIQRKGWRAAINAFRNLRDDNPESRVHLLLCGEGEETDRYLAMYEDDPNITFLGYQSRIHGLYRLSDVALVPTRFSGESYPLCITQAFQTGTPVVSTKLGEIESMMSGTDGIGGILIEYERDTASYTNNLQRAMNEILEDSVRERYALAASRRGEAFSMGEVARDYVELYERLDGFDYGPENH